MRSKTFFRTNLCAISLVILCAVNPVNGASQDWQMQLTAGERLVELQDLTGAESRMRQALRQAQSMRPAQADDVAKCMQRLARLLQTEGRTEEATDLYKQAIAALQKAHGPKSETLLGVLFELGGVYENEAEFKRAANIYTRASQIAESVSGKASVLYARALHLLGHAYYELADVAPSAKCYKTSLFTLMQQPELTSDELLRSVLNDYAQLLRTKGTRKVVVSALETQLLRDRMDALGQTKGVPASNWNQKGFSYATQTTARVLNQNQRAGSVVTNSSATDSGRISSMTTRQLPPDPVALQNLNRQRVEFYERMIAVDIKSLGENHPSVARDLTGLAAVYVAQNQDEQARQMLERAIEIYSKNYADNNEVVRRAKTMLEYLTTKTSIDSDAPTETIDMLATQSPIPEAAQKLETALALNELAFLCYEHGMLPEAQEIYRWALADTLLTTGPQSLLVAASLKDFATVERASGKAGEAEQKDHISENIFRRARVKEMAALFSL